MNEQNNNLNGQTNINPGMPEPGMPNPGMPEPVMPNPGMPNPGMPEPVMPNPGMPNPGMLNPGMPNPGMPEPGMPNPVMPNPGMPEPVMPNPGMPNPGMLNPGMPEPVMPNPGMPNPGMPNPGMPNPGMPNPGMTNPKKSNKKLILSIIFSIVGFAIGFLVVYLIFSGGKSLNCTMSENTMGMELTANLDIKFKGDEVSKANIDMVFDLGSFASYKDTMLESFKEQYSSDELEGMDVKITSDDTKIYIKMSATKDNFKNSGFSTEGNYKEVKADLEEQGFTCK